jgi:Flp pilus assembly protein TadD
MRRVAVTLALAALLPTAPALSQNYPSQPLPTTTALPALRSQASAREVHERFRIGIDALERRDYARAEPEFGRIVSIRPPEPQTSTASYDLAIAQAGLGKNDEAAASLRAAIALDPGFLAAMANLVAVDLRRGDLREARSVADRFVAAAPDSARALYSRGLVALRANDIATAKDDFSRLLRNDPQYALAHYDLGVAEARNGDYAAAERDFETSLRLAPAYALARFALGTILLRQGDRVAARSAFDRAARDAQSNASLYELAVQMRDAIPIPHR